VKTDTFLWGGEGWGPERTTWDRDGKQPDGDGKQMSERAGDGNDFQYSVVSSPCRPTAY